MSSEKLPFTIQKGCIVPANKWATDKMRERKYSLGDIVFVQIRKPRNHKFNSLVHGGFARLLIENIEDFSHMTPHGLLKRLQIETGIGCTEIGVILPGLGPSIYRLPESLSFESMGEERFKEIFIGFCRYIAEKYWPDMEPAQIEHLSEVMENE